MDRYPLYIEMTGNGKPMVLLHGLMGSRRYWQSLVGYFAHTWRVLTPDLLGFGDSPKPSVEYSVNDHLRALHDTLSLHLASGEKLLLAGHSMGALLSLHYALQYSEQVDRLVLINPPAFSTWAELQNHAAHSWDSRLLNLFAYGRMGRAVCWLHNVFPGLLTPAARVFANGLPLEVAEDSLKHTWRSYHGSFENVLLGRPLASLLKQIQAMPVLLIASETDEHSSRAIMLRLAQQPNVRLAWVAGGHHLPLSNPQLVRELMENFFNETLPQNKLSPDCHAT